MSETTQAKSHRILLAIGYVALFLGISLTCRIVWEETWLTWHEGPQMIGFSLAHGCYAPLLLAPIILVIWLLIGIVICVVDRAKRFKLNTSLIITICIGVATLGALMLPGTFWQWTFIASFAKSPHSGDLMTDAAAQGATSTVRSYLNHKVPIEAKDYEGCTSAFTAAAAGRFSTLRLLVDRGADLNATNSYGDSPLEAAIRSQRQNVIQFLREHNARRIIGTPEQRDAASKAIVQRAIERDRD